MLSSAFDPGSAEEKTADLKDTVENSLPSPIQAEIYLSEGGIEAWCTVLGAFLAQFCGFGYTNSFGVYQAFYTRYYLQSESASAISWIGSLATFLVLAMGPISGRLFDNGYFYHAYISGAVLTSLSIFMLSLVHPGKYYQVMLLQGFMCGIGQGLMYTPSFAVLSHHFKHRRTAMLSVAASGVALGGISHTIMLNKLLNGPLGFKTGVRISAAFVTVLLFLSCILVRPRYGAVRQESESVDTWKATKKCFTEIPSLLTILGFTLYETAFTYPYFYFQINSLKHGLNATFAFYSVVIISVGSFVGRLVPGALLVFLGVIDLTIMSTFACAILFIGMIWLGSMTSIIVLGTLYGFFSGICIGIMAPMFGLTSDPTELGVRMGVGFAFSGIGCLIGSPISGALLTRDYRWWVPALFCGVISLVGSILFVGVRFSFGRWQEHANATEIPSHTNAVTQGNESGIEGHTFIA